jgi:hypothetical protein
LELKEFTLNIEVSSKVELVGIILHEKNSKSSSFFKNSLTKYRVEFGSIALPLCPKNYDENFFGLLRRNLNHKNIDIKRFL